MIDPFHNFSALREHVNAETAARESARRADRVSSGTREIEDKLDKLTLVCMAMWSLLQDKIDVDEKQLLERVRILDMMDGVADGKATKTVSQCPKCKRTMSPRHNKCLYCGHAQLVQSAFDAI